MLSTKSRQSIIDRKRMLPMLLLIETWLAACCWLSACTISSIEWPESPSHCSIQVSGNARVVLCPCNRRASSETNELDIGGLERTMSASTRTRLLGSDSATDVSRSAQLSAIPRSIRCPITRALTRRRFSMRASRSMIGIAHNSPMRKGVTPW